MPAAIRRSITYVNDEAHFRLETEDQQPVMAPATPPDAHLVSLGTFSTDYSTCPQQPRLPPGTARFARHIRPSCCRLYLMTYIHCRPYAAAPVACIGTTVVVCAVGTVVRLRHHPFRPPQTRCTRRCATVSCHDTSSRPEISTPLHLSDSTYYRTRLCDLIGVHDNFGFILKRVDKLNATDSLLPFS